MNGSASWWTASPGRPALPHGRVHVWRADLDEPGWTNPVHAAFLDDSERARAARLIQPRRRRRFCAAHAMLRTVLSRYVEGAGPASLAFVSGATGKPELDAGNASPPVRFNLSHSDGVALVAVARACAVGIDVEGARRDVRIEEIARRQFHPDVVRALLGVDPPRRAAAFLRCWCALEARLKASGTGFAAAGAGLMAQMGLPEPLLASLDAAEWAGVAGPWALSALDAGPGFAAVVAAEAAAVAATEAWLETFAASPLP